MNLGIASNDWSQSYTDGITPAMGGSGWIRLGQYLEYMDFEEIILGRLAYHVDRNLMAVSDWQGNIHTDFPILIMQRYMIKGLPQDMDKCKGRTIIVQDIDDWYWGLNPANHAHRATNPKLNPINNIDLYKQVIARSDYIITSTPYLGDRLAQYFGKDKIILHENHVDIGKYKNREHTESEKPIIGWFGSTAHRSSDLEILRGVLSQVEGRFGFAHVGDMRTADANHYRTFHEGVGIKEESMSYTLPLLPPDELVEKGFDYDIGIVPLNDIPFNHAKSWIKGLEYAAAKIPFIATPVAEYRRFKEEYGVGRLAKSPKEWLRHLNELRDPEVRRIEAEENYEKIQKLDVREGARTLEAILKAMV